MLVVTHHMSSGRKAKLNKSAHNLFLTIPLSSVFPSLETSAMSAKKFSNVVQVEVASFASATSCVKHLSLLFTNHESIVSTLMSSLNIGSLHVMSVIFTSEAIKPSALVSVASSIDEEISTDRSDTSYSG